MAFSLAGVHTVRKLPAFRSPYWLHFLRHGDAAAAVETDCSLDNVDRDNVLRILVYQLKFDC